MTTNKNISQLPDATSVGTNDFFHLSQGGVDKKIPATELSANFTAGQVNNPVVKVESTSARTLTTSDRFAYIRCTNVALTTITIPPSTDVSWVIGDLVSLSKATIGDVTVAGGVGVTVNPSSSGLALTEIKQGGTLIYLGNDEWDFLTGGNASTSVVGISTCLTVETMISGTTVEGGLLDYNDLGAQNSIVKVVYNNLTSKTGSAEYTIKTVAQAAADGDVIDGTGAPNYLGANHSLTGGTHVAILSVSPADVTSAHCGALYDGTSDDVAIAKCTAYLRAIDNPDNIFTSTLANTVSLPRTSYVWDGGTTGPVFNLLEGESIEDSRIQGWVNPVVRITNIDNAVSNVHITGNDAASEQPNQCVQFDNGSISPLVSFNYFDRCNYQIVQLTGANTYGPRIIGNHSSNSSLDFILQNNDTQNGLTHSWLVLGNYCDQTDSEFGYGQTESRGIGFTSCYGGMAIGNAMVACKGDSATHLENFQETMFIGNYYRDNQLDTLYSGLADRRLVSLNITVGTVAIGQIITDSVSGAAGEILFFLEGGDIVQVINITGGSFGAGNAFTTDGGASGTVIYNNEVQTHANHIGNIFHKTNDDTVTSMSSSGGPYFMRNFFIGNTYNNQGHRAGKTAISFPARYDMSTMMNCFTGWESALNGGGGTALDNEFAFNKYWGNEYNVNGINIVENSQWFKEKFYDGIFKVANLKSSSIEGCLFESGSIDIQSTTNDNTWRSNKVSAGVTLTNLNPLDFISWESESYTKHNDTHVIRVSTAINSGSTVKELLATLTPIAGNVSMTVEWRLTSRSPTSGGRRAAEIGRASVTWDGASAPSIVNDVANFTNGVKTIGFTLDISGTNVLANFDYTATGYNSFATIEVTITANAATVTPVNFLDLI